MAEVARSRTGVVHRVVSLQMWRVCTACGSRVQSSLYATKVHRLLPLQSVVLASLILLGNR